MADDHAPVDRATVDRASAERVLRRAGFSPSEIRTVLDDVRFPAARSVITRRAQRFGISTGSLMERLGSSP